MFKAKGTHHYKKMSCKPGGNCIQKQHFISLKNPGLIIEELMWGMMVSTQKPVYYLGEEVNQRRVEQKGGE